MEKWADFIITKTKYNQEHSRIEEVEVRPDLGEKVGAASRMSRKEVVDAIRRQQTFVTGYQRQREGAWSKGESVGIVPVARELFIRTDSNSTKADNLGSLPEYA